MMNEERFLAIGGQKFATVLGATQAASEAHRHDEPFQKLPRSSSVKPTMN